MKSAGKASAQPLKDVFTKWNNLRQVLILLFGATAACSVVAYTAHIYPLFYLQTILRVNEKATIFAVAVGILTVLPFVTRLAV